MGSLTQVPGEEPIRLRRDPWRKRYKLLSLVTLESFDLPLGSWELGFDDGQGYVHSVNREADGASMEVLLVGDCMQYQLSRAPGTEELPEQLEMRHRESGRVIHISALQTTRTLRRVSLQPSGVGGAFFLDVAVFHWPKDGCSVMWNVGEVHTVAGFTQYNGRAAEWTKHQWDKWARKLGSLHNLPERHMLKSRAYATDVSEASPTDRPELELPLGELGRARCSLVRMGLFGKQARRLLAGSG